MQHNKTILFILILSCYSFSFAQKKIDFNPQITKLNKLGKQIVASKNDEQKYQINKEYSTLLREVVENNASFDYDFEALKTSSVLQENNLKIYNWVLPLTDGTYHYFAFLQFREKKQFKCIELIDKSDEIKNPEYTTVSNENWYGALYYKIIYAKKLGSETYTLLGWDGNNQLSNKKLIEVVTINKEDVKFGVPIFKTKGNQGVKKRVIFEYTKDAVMSLTYHEKINKIVFNQLHPISSNFEGIYEYYAPSLNRFDAYVLHNNKWLLEKQVSIFNEKSQKDKDWKNPNR